MEFQPALNQPDRFAAGQQATNILSKAISPAEERMQRASEAAVIGFWEIDIPSGALWLSANFTGVLNVDDGQPQSDNKAFITSFLPQEAVLALWSELDKTMRGEGDLHIAYRMTHPQTGEVNWFESHGTLIRTEEGTPARVVGTAQNITERKLAEEALRQSEERYRTLFSSIDEGYVLGEIIQNEQGVPVDYRILDVNPAYEAITGLTKESVVGQTVLAITPNIEPEWIETVGRVALVGESVRYENQVKDLDSWFETFLSPMGDRGNGKFIAIFNNITYRKRAEEMIRQSEDRLQKALSIETVGVLFFDVDGTVTDGNDAFLHLSGHQRQTMEQGHLNLSTITSSEWQPATLRSINELKETGRSSPYEKQLIRPDGSHWWGLFAGTRLSEQENVEFVLDITQRKQAEASLQESDRRKDEFLALLAHELRNPLATLSNTLLILQLTQGQDDVLPLELALSMMDAEIKQLVHLVDDLLDVSRINQGKFQLHLQKLDLTGLVRQTIAATQLLVEAGRRQLSTTLPDVPVYVNGDATRLVQLIRNLLNNATKFTNEDGQIQISLEQVGQEALLRVVDNGIGIPPDQLVPIFDMFTQVDASRTRSQGGLGLGLTLVNQFVTLHGGWVEAQSEGSGKGSIFTVHLPVFE